jgi:hypothetical protein
VFILKGIDPKLIRPSKVTVAVTPKPGLKHLYYLLCLNQKAIQAQSKLFQSIFISKVNNDYYNNVKSVTS